MIITEMQSCITKEIIEELTDLLGSELDEFDIKYTYKIVDDLIEVKFSKFTDAVEIFFKYNHESEILLICINYDLDYFERISIYDSSVRYLWILLAPVFFKNDEVAK